MSYILDALRRSEEERHQEQLKSLTGHDGLIHVSKQKVPVWPYLLIAALAINAVIFIWLHIDRASLEQQSDLNMPIKSGSGSLLSESEAQDSAITSESNARKDIVMKEEAVLPETVVHLAAATTKAPGKGVLETSAPVRSEGSASPAAFQADGEDRNDIYIDGGLLIQPKGKQRSLPSSVTYTQTSAKPTVTIASQPISFDHALNEQIEPYRDVPRLIDMDVRFQRSVPTLTFNSHIYSDNPSARRVMINNIYLSEGQMLSGMVVVMIGETDIVFKKGDRLFKRGVMRDW